MKTQRLTVLIFSIISLALTARTGQAAACPTAALSTYVVPGFTCTINGLTFSQFTHQATSSAVNSPGSAPIPVGSASILVTPITATANEGLQFSGGWNTGSASNVVEQLNNISYVVTGVNIASLHTWFNGSATGTGIATANTTYCVGSAPSGTPPDVCPPSPAIALSTAGSVLNGTATFAPTTTLGVRPVIDVTSVGVGTAAVSELVNTFRSASAPTLTKGYLISPINIFLPELLTFTISNNNAPNQVSLTGVSFQDSLPAGQFVTSFLNNCGGSVTALTNSNTISLSGGSLAAGATCGVFVVVNGAFTGTSTNLYPELVTNEFGRLPSSGSTSLTRNGNFGTADLTVVMTHFGSFVAGRQGVYTIKVANSGGGSTSGAVTVKDTLPAGWTAVSMTGTGWSGCTLGATPTCSRSDSLGAGSLYPDLNLVVNVPANAAGTINNGVAVSGGGETFLASLVNTFTDPTVIGVPPAACTTQLLSTYLTAGFQCSIGNIVFSGFSYGATAEVGTLAISADVIVVTPATDPGNEGLRFSGAWNVASPPPTPSDATLDSLVSYTASTFDGSPSITGLKLDYQGSSVATGQSSVTEAYCLGNSLAGCPTGAIRELAGTNPPFNQTPFATFAGVATAGISQDINVTSGSHGSAGISAVLATITNGVAGPGPDLAISKIHNANIRQGDLLADLYTIRVTNVGTAATTLPAVIADSLPAGMTVLSKTQTGTFNCNDPLLLSSAVLSCNIPSGLAAGAFVELSLSVQVSTTAVSPAQNAATISGGGDLNTSNNLSLDTAIVTPMPNLTITKSHTGNFKQGDADDIYTITVTNAGGAPTSGNYTTSDTLPAGLSLTALEVPACPITDVVIATSFTCTSNVVIPAGGSLVFTLHVKVAANAAPSVTNVATVSGGGEIFTSDDTASDITAVTQVADLTITKFHTGFFRAGELSDTFTMTVVNAGPGPTVGATTLTDTPGQGLLATAIAGAGWQCVQPAGPCTRSDVLTPGNSYPPVVLTVNVDTRPPVTLINTASVSGGGQLNLLNDTVTDNAAVVDTAPDMTITKTHTGNFTQGVNGVYTITARNSGTGPTVGTVTVTDAIPAGEMFVSATGAGWTFGLNGQTVTATRTDALAGSASYPAITLTVQLAANATASITNTATVAGGSEANLANDSASDVATVTPSSVTVTVGTSALGASFTVDSVTYNTTQTFTWAVNSLHNISTTSPQQLPAFVGPTYTFQSWSDGGAIAHQVTATLGTTSYVATFQGFGR